MVGAFTSGLGAASQIPGPAEGTLADGVLRAWAAGKVIREPKSLSDLGNRSGFGCEVSKSDLAGL